MQSSADTIFAAASGGGRAALTVVRVSGPNCAKILADLAGGLPRARRASLRRLRGKGAETLDRGLVLWFPGPGSYTGEDSFELHLHGGTAVLHGVMDALAASGARPADAGEFTRRAVTHGRMDLLEAEAVADLIASETVLQRDQALRQLGGGLGSVIQDWSARLLRLLAQQEALIDFPDEDLPPEVDVALLHAIASLRSEIASHHADADRGERLRSGLVFAIAGEPNAGKSTLINTLCRREVAIVSPRPGTTRDLLEARVDIAGIPVTLVDTAGLRDATDPVEAEGVRRAYARIRSADLVIFLQQAGTSAVPWRNQADPPGLFVWSKADLVEMVPIDHLAISATSGVGMQALMAALEAKARRLTATGASPVFSRERHRQTLIIALAHLTASLDAPLPELRGEELRLALQALGRLTGTVGVEDVLDSVFGQFCIGK